MKKQADIDNLSNCISCLERGDLDKFNLAYQDFVKMVQDELKKYPIGIDFRPGSTSGDVIMTAYNKIIVGTKMSSSLGRLFMAHEKSTPSGAHTFASTLTWPAFYSDSLENISVLYSLGASQLQSVNLTLAKGSKGAFGSFGVSTQMGDLSLKEEDMAYLLSVAKGRIINPKDDSLMLSLTGDEGVIFRLVEDYIHYNSEGTSKLLSYFCILEDWCAKSVSDIEQALVVISLGN